VDWDQGWDLKFVLYDQRRMTIALLALEIGPLQEPGYTGIARVVGQVAAQMLAETDFEVRFFVERKEVPRSVVEEVVTMSGGKEFGWIVRNSAFPPISALTASPSVGLFGAVKTAHFVFDYEAQIIHDLSTFVVPQFHHRDTIRHHAETTLRDVSSNDLNICVSEATRSDLERYFPEAPRHKNLVAYPAWLWPDRFADLYRDMWADCDTEKYILVLGTIEPRKNIDVVLNFIAENPTITDRYKFVFLGKYGWGSAIDDKLTQYNLSDTYDKGRVVFPGFVGEFTKYVMLANAALVVYPSLFEGFGLPVVEALSLGKAVVTTASSSLPEVGGDAVYYFDPFQPESLGAVMGKAFYDLARKPEQIAARARQRAEIFSWAKFYRAIKERISQDLGDNRQW
jgi:glycosyltransferase involved in cell wall biosynthesis